MSHNQHQTHQPKGVAKKTCCEPCNVESLPRVSVKSPAIHPGFKIHHHQSQRRRPNVAGMPFRTPSVFLFLKIKSWDQTSWKKGWSTLIVFFVLYTSPKKVQKKTCQQKWFCLIVVSWVWGSTTWTSRMMRISQRKTMACSRTLVPEDLRGEKKHGK